MPVVIAEPYGVILSCGAPSCSPHECSTQAGSISRQKCVGRPQVQSCPANAPQRPSRVAPHSTLYSRLLTARAARVDWRQANGNGKRKRSHDDETTTTLHAED